MNQKELVNELDVIANKASHLQSQVRFHAPDLDECDAILMDLKERIEGIQKVVKEEGWPISGTRSGS